MKETQSSLAVSWDAQDVSPVYLWMFSSVVFFGFWFLFNHTLAYSHVLRFKKKIKSLD